MLFGVAGFEVQLKALTVLRLQVIGTAQALELTIHLHASSQTSSQAISEAGDRGKEEEELHTIMPILLHSASPERNNEQPQQKAESALSSLRFVTGCLHSSIE
jgi:hypothetical protein